MYNIIKSCPKYLRKSTQRNTKFLGNVLFFKTTSSTIKIHFSDKVKFIKCTIFSFAIYFSTKYFKMHMHCRYLELIVEYRNALC